jgi:predicted Zn-dependent peptidase
MVLHPTFLKKETDKEVTVILDEIESYNDSPSELIYDDFENMIFEGSSLAMPILGTKKTLKRISKSPDYPLNWMKQHYRPERMVLFVLGNVSPKQVIAAAEKELGHLASVSSSTSVSSPSSLTNSKERIYRRHTHQTHVMLGSHSFPIGHPKQLTMFLLNNILGGGSMSSRLYLSLREKYGLVYNVDSQAVPLSDTGYWNIYLACEPQYKDQCLELVHGELKKLRDVRLTSTQLQRALSQLQGQLAISAENQENNALAMAKQMLYHHRAPQWQETFAKVQKITSEQLQEVANEVFDTNKIATLQYA